MVILFLLLQISSPNALNIKGWMLARFMLSHVYMNVCPTDKRNLRTNSPFSLSFCVWAFALCMSMCPMHTGAHGGQRGPGSPESLELALQSDVCFRVGAGSATLVLF